MALPVVSQSESQGVLDRVQIVNNVTHIKIKNKIDEAEIKVAEIREKSNQYMPNARKNGFFQWVSRTVIWVLIVCGVIVR